MVMRSPELRATFDRGLRCELFAGGGGASTGIAAALGECVDIAVNHSPEAMAVHAANHPSARHYIANVWDVDPVEACGDRPVSLLWASPDCTHFSKAKGGKPKSKKTRSLACVVIRWAKAVRPAVIFCENVDEFETWGPLDSEGQPDPARAGRCFKSWCTKLRNYGYRLEWRSLVAANYGTPTKRRRLYLVARCDGEAITWPTATHPERAWLPASSVIDWTIPVPSIFGRRKPLADATLARIAEGLRRYVTAPGARLFRVPGATPSSARNGAFVAAWITKHYGGVVGQTLDLPLGTVTAIDHHSLTTATLEPIATAAQSPAVYAYLTKYYKDGGTQQSLFEPLHTVTTVARFGLVLVHGTPHAITDVSMRMLQPRELFAAQGFPDDYIIDAAVNGRPLSKAAQTRLAGNSVCPPMAAAIVAANIRRERTAAA